jgi:hypothetical protein
MAIFPVSNLTVEASCYKPAKLAGLMLGAWLVGL